jgi:hypothetical protein
MLYAEQKMIRKSPSLRGVACITSREESELMSVEEEYLVFKADKDS